MIKYWLLCLTMSGCLSMMAQGPALSSAEAQRPYSPAPLNGLLAPAVAKAAEDAYARLLLTDRLVKPVLLVVDLSRPSHEKRLSIIDMRDTTLIHKSLVAHGMKSGEESATTFSNVSGSNCSSLGAYLTAETYIGKHGESLKLDGIDIGLNDHARARAIVMHSADYVSEEFIAENGRLGRSLGCPALPEVDFAAVIRVVKEGAALFIYGDGYESLLETAQTD